MASIQKGGKINMYKVVNLADSRTANINDDNPFGLILEDVNEVVNGLNIEGFLRKNFFPKLHYLIMPLAFLLIWL